MPTDPENVLKQFYSSVTFYENPLPDFGAIQSSFWQLLDHIKLYLVYLFLLAFLFLLILYFLFRKFTRQVPIFVQIHPVQRFTIFASIRISAQSNPLLSGR